MSAAKEKAELNAEKSNIRCHNRIDSFKTLSQRGSEGRGRAGGRSIGGVLEGAPTVAGAMTAAADEAAAAMAAATDRAYEPK